MICTNLVTGICSRSIHQRGLNAWNQVNPWFRREGASSFQPTNSASRTMIVRFRSNRSRRGLYDGKDVRSGNNVSFSMKATKRTFKPNVFVKRLYSEILDELIRFRVTASALRTMDKLGGLDKYLLKSEHVTEGTGMAVKRRLLKKLKHLDSRNSTEEETNPFLTISTLDATDDIATENNATAEEPSTPIESALIKE